MGLDKHSYQADRAANFYRAALYLGKGDTQTGLDFLKKAGWQDYDKPKTRQQELVLAEKALDQYQQLRMSL